jgi:putative membrane-bound dehydrogenase-like protein
MSTRLLAVLATIFFVTSSSVAQVPPEKAEATFTVHNAELEWKLWASEPLFANPTSMDIDHLGRIWVCESVNYRTTLHKKPLNRAAGDRILILEDSRKTGKADKVTVFYQSPELLAPLGIAVAKDPVGPGWKVYVCQSPDILVFEDKNGTGHADGPPKKLLTGFKGIDHDHGVHGILIGPDGKLYFSVGDQGVENLQSSDGKGRKWTTNHTDCQAGTLWRCDMDGTNLELIAHNFRNPYEPCVDSFGNIWMSDNDDDGNEQTRICYVMPGGNYGYWPRGKGESHWHEEQPGVVPKVLRTYFGSPTGMCVYEGTLLPKKYWGMPLHVDAGPRQVRCYHTKPKGAGYEIEREDVVTSTDTWFRPSDICVAPDGSVFVADWYDPGVGGHGMGDTTRGRIYRLAPKGSKYVVPKVDLGTRTGLRDALGAPCIASRTLAHLRLKEMKGTRDQFWTIGLPYIDEVLEQRRLKGTPPNEVLIARIAWILSTQVDRSVPMSDRACGAAMLALRIDGPALGLYYRIWSDLAKRGYTPDNPRAWLQIDQLLDTKFPLRSVAHEAVWFAFREALCGSERSNPELTGARFASFAKQYDGHDRFYLAAIGIAVGTEPKRREFILADFDKQFPEWNDKVADLVWELRPPTMMPRLGKLLLDEKLTASQRARIVDILATADDKAAGFTVLKVLQTDVPAEVKTRAIENLKLFLPGKWSGLAKSEELKPVIDRLLGEPKSVKVGLQLVAAAKFLPALDRIAGLAAAGDPEAIGTLGQLPDAKAVASLEMVYRSAIVKARSSKPGNDDPFGVAVAAVNALALLSSGPADSPATKEALVDLQGIITAADDPSEFKRPALAGLAASRAGTQWLLNQKERNRLSPDLVADAGRLLRNSPFQGLRNRAMIAFPPPNKLDIAKLPALGVLAARRGDVERGKQIMAASLKGDAQCMKCHAVKGVGGNVGPDLATIGTKASRENLFESILYPSKAIADQWVQWNVTTTRGTTISGLIVEDKPDYLILRDANGKDSRIERRDISDKERNPKSVMPDDIARTLTEEELVDLVEYLVTLQSGGVK